MATTTDGEEGCLGHRRGLLRSIIESERSVIEEYDDSVRRIAEDLEDNGWEVKLGDGSGWAATLGRIRVDLETLDPRSESEPKSLPWLSFRFVVFVDGRRFLILYNSISTDTSPADVGAHVLGWTMEAISMARFVAAVTAAIPSATPSLGIRIGPNDITIGLGFDRSIKVGLYDASGSFAPDDAAGAISWIRSMTPGRIHEVVSLRPLTKSNRPAASSSGPTG